jgi:transposase
MRTRDYTPPSDVSIVGIDDWAWKKGTTYGTIVVDLELHKPIELLPDRSAATAEAWLQTHPELQLVSRDRGGDYAAAARRGAPQAEQAADKFHLIKNLRECLKDLMVRHHSRLPEVEERGSDAIPAKAQGRKREPEQQKTHVSVQTAGPEKHYRTIPASAYQRPERVSYSASQKQMRREKRQSLYEAVRTLAAGGMSQREIARKLALARETVSKFLHAEEYPEIHHKKRRERSSILDPYRGYILERWQQGCRNSVQLYDEITTLGFKGSAPLLRLFLAELRKKHREAEAAQALTLDTATQSVTTLPEKPPKHRITHRMSPSKASWLFIRQIEDLGKQQKQQIEQIRMVHPELEAAYQLTQNFVFLLINHQPQDLDAWLTQADGSSILELKRFAKGIHRDYDAVRTACSTSWS